MAATELILNGKKYVSSARAAQLVGYTKDYVGQLARAGKIESQLIGRSWYVSEESIQKHKVSVHYTLKNPKKPRKSATTSDETTIETKVISPIAPRDSEVREVSSRAPEFEETTARKEASDVLVHADIVYEKEPPLQYDDLDVPRDEEPENSTIDGDPDARAIRSIPIRVPQKRSPAAHAHHSRAPSYRDRQHVPVSLDGVAAPTRQAVRREQLGTRRRSADIHDVAIHDEERTSAGIRTVRMHRDSAPPRSERRIARELQRDVRPQPAPQQWEDDYEDDVFEGSPPPRRRSERTRSHDRSSKAVPVLGALVFLAACVLAYLLFAQ